MNTLIKSTLLLLTMTSTSVFAVGGASEHSTKTSKHSTLASTHGVVASAKTTSGIIAIPFKAVGVIGHVSGQAGDALMDNAITTTPLEISDKTITAGAPPKDVMNINMEPQINLQEL